MTNSKPVLTEPWEVNRRLAELGLPENALQEAAKSGLAAWAACTPNHPTMYPGIVAWGETTRVLRDHLVLLGWNAINESGQALVVNASGTIAVMVAGGDENTGIHSLNDPRTKSAKGPKTIEAIQRNQWLFPEMEEEDRHSHEARGKRQTWVLLLARDMQAGELRAELSIPMHMTDDCRISEWSERVILGPIPFGGIDQSLTRGGAPSDPGKTPEIVVEIKRRA